MNRKIDRKIKMILFSLVGVSLFMSSCIKEDIEPCELKISFNYSYNMLSSDALADQADELQLYIFDKQGTLVSQHSVQGETMTNGLYIDAPETGDYHFVAWAKSNALTNSEADFEIPELTVGSSKIETLTYSLKRDEGISRQALNHFLVGTTKANIHPTTGVQTVTVDLKKVTKKIRLVILPYSGNSLSLDVNDYEFHVTDPVGNGHVNYDYTLLKDQPTTYYPYYKANISPAAEENPTAGEIDKAIAVEISTSRILDTHQPRLYITSKSDKREIVNINLPWLFSLTEMESHKDWKLQEYLDRQDEYVITLFLDGNKWINSTIVINGWVVNEIDF